MRNFLTVFLASVTLVTSQGYNYRTLQSIGSYQYPISGQQQSLITPLRANLANPILQHQQRKLAEAGQYQQFHQHVSAPVDVAIAPVVAPVQSFSSAPSFLSSANPLASRVRVAPRTRKPIVTKSFFIHTAPEETEEDIQEEIAQLAQQPRKHYNVLFIKAPSQSNKATALNFANALNEEKTVVYVLTKKTTAADLQEAIHDTPQRVHKPEVFFIKYRTHEEAANAQRQIQAQYDNLEGSSTISDEGISSITSVIGSLDAPEETQQVEQVDGTVVGQSYEEPIEKIIDGNQYLPPQY